MSVSRSARALLGAALTAVLVGCAGSGGPRPIAAGMTCARCGMSIEDLRFACERERDGDYRVYDSIECLLGDGVSSARAWLADYDTRTLHAAESTWVVRGDLPSPMGGGFVAFLDRAAADDIAAVRHGQVARLSVFADSASAGARP